MNVTSIPDDFAPTRPAKARSARVLIVEDQADQARLLQLQLERTRIAPFTTSISGSMLEAIRSLNEEERPDVLVLDLNLPDANGLLTLSAIQVAAPSVPVVILSSVDDPETRLLAIEQGAQDYVVKQDTRSPEDIALALLFAIERHRWRTRLQSTIREARESEAQLRRIVSHESSATLVVDSSTGEIIFCNPAAARLLGASTTDEVLRQPFPHSIPRREQGPVEIEILRPNGKLVVVEMTTSPFQWRGRQKTLITLHDVTRRKELAQAQREFLGMISHDIKSPLMGIAGYAELLDEEEGLSEEQRSFVLGILGNVERVRALSQAFVDSIRLESGALTPNPRPVDLNVAVGVACTGLAGLARHSGVELASKTTPGIEPIALDPDLLDRILINLVGNALRFTPRGKSVRVETEREGGRARIHVVDEGPGLSPEAKTILFGRFVPPELGGTGLGLYVTKKFVDVLGGEIFAADESGGGTRFTVAFPTGS